MKQLIVIIGILVLAIPTISAQDSAEDLLELLNTVPDTDTIRQNLITFIDYENLFESRAGTPQLNSIAALEILPAPIQQTFRAALRGINSGPAIFTNVLLYGSEWRETIGFDFMDIDRALAYGNPPDNVDILVGEFDLDAIDEAFTARGYTADDFGDMTIWCPEIGCDAGLEIDFELRNEANPFGGDLGRQQPLLVSDRIIANSAVEASYILVEDAIGDRFDSLADNATYRAAVGAIEGDNLIIQGAFLHPALVILDPSVTMSVPADEVDEMMREVEVLSPWDVAMIADTATDSEEVVYVILVYRELALAEEAVATIPERINTMNSIMTEEPFQALFSVRGVEEVIGTVVTDEENERFMAVLEFRAPLPDNTEDDMGTLTQSSRVYQLLISMVYSRDLIWLATGMN